MRCFNPKCEKELISLTKRKRYCSAGCKKRAYLNRRFVKLLKIRQISTRLEDGTKDEYEVVKDPSYSDI